MARQPVTGVRRLGQFLAGLAALVTLTALMVGVPLLLAKIAGNPLPHHVPRLDEVWTLLTTRDSGQLFLRTLAVVAWVAWATFALAMLVEATAAVRHRPSLRLPGLSMQQRLAAVLIASIAMMIHAPAAASAAAARPLAAPARPPAVATISEVPGRPILTALQLPIRQPSTATVQGQLVYVVAHGDRLADVAARFLGDANRYREIASLNRLSDADHIEGRQRLRLPADAADRGVRAHASGQVIGQSTASAAAEQPAPTQEPPTADPSATTEPSAPPSTTASRSASASAAVSIAPSLPPSPSHTAAPTPPGAAAAPAQPNGYHPAEDDSMLDQLLLVGVPLLGAGLLATLTLTTLRRRRRQQEQHRPAGRRIPDSVDPAVETNLRVVAQPVAVDRFDHALRALAASLVGRPAEQVPDIVGAWLDGSVVNLLLTEPCPHPPAPWIATGTNWSLPADAPLPEADGQLAPLPTLVTVGSQPGMHLLLDLERLGLITITGNIQKADDLLRYLAAELACNSWSDHVEVTVAGFDAEQTGQLIALGGERIDAAPNITVAVERIRRKAGQVLRSLEHLGATDPLTGRINDIAADAWMPHLLLVKDPNPADVEALEALDNDFASAGRCAVAVAVTSDTPIGRWRLVIDDAGRLTITFLGITGPDATLAAACLPRNELDNLAQLLAATRTGPAPAADTTPPDKWPQVPPAPEPELWANGTDAAGGLLDTLPGEAHPTDLDHVDESDPSDDEALEPEPPVEQARPVTPTPAHEPSAEQDADREGRAPVPAVVALVGRQPAKRLTANAARRRHVDPTLDEDLRAWNEHDPNRPRIAILGPVTVEAPGQLPTERLRFYAEIITYLATRGERGATTDQLDEALWPGQQVKATSRRVAVARARRWLGETPDGDAWLPDATGDRRYRLRLGYLLDWHLFRRLRSRGESRGPAGTADLRQALTLVRGAPLTGADIAYSAVARNPYTWLPTSEIQPHHLTSAVVDTAHRLVGLCLEAGDLNGARWAVEQVWLADTDRASDITWRDMLRVAAAEGNAAELDELFGELIRVREAEVPEDLDVETFRLLCELMPERLRAGVH